MNARTKQTTSVRLQTGALPVYAARNANVQPDVCVVGAGIAGMMTADMLLKEQKSVIVLDDRAIGGGQTERTTPHLSIAIDNRYTEIESKHGQDGARLAAESHRAAIDKIETTGSNVRSSRNIVPGAGAVVRRGLTKIAVYRDETGSLHECSAVCPHLGCIVKWNANGSTWDCPCHGSRFDKLGAVLCGPANRDLAALDPVVLPMEPPLLAGL